MRFDVTLPSSGQDRWASSLYTSNVMIQIQLRTLLMFIRVIKIKRLIKNTFYTYTDIILKSDLYCVQPEAAAATYDPRLRY